MIFCNNKVNTYILRVHYSRESSLDFYFMDKQKLNSVLAQMQDEKPCVEIGNYLIFKRIIQFVHCYENQYTKSEIAQVENIGALVK